MTIELEESYDVDAERLFNALTRSDQFAAATGAPATIDAKPGGALSCFGEQIEGRFIELAPGERIVQAWRAAAWPPGVYSIVTFRLSPEGPKTKLSLEQAGYPAEAEDHLKGGWGKMYFEPLRAYLS